jgi:L-aspartate oxidase
VQVKTTHSEAFFLKSHVFDYLIVGTGLAGLSLALKVSRFGRVAILSKTAAPFGNSAMAQGGIAAVVSQGDTFEQHIQDTHIAGDGLCKHEIVENIIRQGPERINDLLNWGVQFDQLSDHNFSLHQEGGHSARRVLHIEDHTGKSIHDQVLKKCLENQDIQFFHDCIGIDLILDESTGQCWGVEAFDKSSGSKNAFLASSVILATGGAGKTYLYTSNWDGSTGDGIAMAHRAGALIKHMEFMQFHPTCLYHPTARNFLITEALRGENAKLINRQGIEFMLGIHPLGSLAPRDIVARSIDLELKKTGAECVYLDCTKMGEEFLKSRFPIIFKRCLELGINIAEKPIPVVPAAHYLIGGVAVSETGATGIKQLYAVGETACTGLHGANRLASNSLLECLATAHNCSEELLSSKRNTVPEQILRQAKNLVEAHGLKKKSEDELALINHLWDEIRTVMWNYVGIVRSNARLKRARERILMIQSEVEEYFETFELSSDLIELRNLARVSEIIIESAARRKESRGTHFNIDYP